MIYKTMSVADAHQLVEWAEENNVEWDVWNAEDWLASTECFVVELGLERWPEPNV